MTQLLIPGLTCAQLFAEARSGVLVDGHDFYKAFYEACCQAQRTILLAGWQFDTKVDLVRGEDATGCELPTRFSEFLHDLAESRPGLEIYMLPWDASAVFAFEREPLQRLRFHLNGHPRIHYKMDNAHPTGASHHQKLVVVDRTIAFVGGMDVCKSRWDDRSHAPVNPCRTNVWRSYTPYHDVQAYVTGPAVDVLRDWFCDRWQRATHAPLALPDAPRAPLDVTRTFDVSAPTLALTRTWPRMERPPTAPIRELFELHLRAIAAAERLIYIENQYLSSDEIGRALERRMRASCDPPLEIVIVLPEKSAGFKERISIGIHQQRILARLGNLAARTGHQLGVYYAATRDADGADVPVFVHAKVLAIDDRFLLVSSANTSNRSMGFDTELGLAWEAPAPTPSLAAARIELLAEHVGLVRARADGVIGAIPGLVRRLDHLARGKQHRLRIHRRNDDERPGWLLAKLLPDENPFDPDDPRSFQEALPEPSRWLDRLFRDPIDVARSKRHRRPKKLATG